MASCKAGESCCFMRLLASTLGALNVSTPIEKLSSLIWTETPYRQVTTQLCVLVFELFIESRWFLSQLNTPMIFLESVVTDSQESVCPFVGEYIFKIDASLAGGEAVPPPVGYISHLPHYKLEDISTATANWSTSVFDWKPRNDGHWKRGEKDIRKMWIGRL